MLRCANCRYSSFEWGDIICYRLEDKRPFNKEFDHIFLFQCFHSSATMLLISGFGDIMVKKLTHKADSANPMLLPETKLCLPNLGRWLLLTLSDIFKITSGFVLPRKMKENFSSHHLLTTMQATIKPSSSSHFWYNGISRSSLTVFRKSGMSIGSPLSF